MADDGRDRHGFMRGWRARRDRISWDHRPEVAPALRSIADTLGLSRDCRRRDCRRRHRCASPKVDCAWQTLDLLQEHVFPVLRDVGPDTDAAREAYARYHAARSRRAER